MSDHVLVAFSHELLVRELSLVVGWDVLGLYLGLDEREIQVIERDHHNTARRRIVMLKRWMEKDVNASWEKVIDALECMSLNALANQLRERYTTESGVGTMDSSSTVMLKQQVEVLQKENSEYKALYDELKKKAALKSEELEAIVEEFKQKFAVCREHEQQLKRELDMAKQSAQTEISKLENELSEARSELSRVQSSSIQQGASSSYHVLQPAAQPPDHDNTSTAQFPLHKPPKMSDLLNRVAVMIRDNWMELGIQLDIEYDRLMVLSRQHHNPTHCFAAMIDLWRKEGSPPYTWATIIDALRTDIMGEMQLAYELEHWVMNI